MRSGLLTEIIEIKRPSVSKNSYGEKVMNYLDHYTTKARLVYNSGDRSTENGEILFNYRFSFEIYDYVDITENDQIYYEGKCYRILSIELNKKQMKKTVRVEEIND